VGVIDDPRVAALRRRYARQLAFVQARLSPEGYLGLYLTIGALILIVSAWFFGGISEDVLHNDPLTVTDLRFSQWLHVRMIAPLTTAMLLITYFGSTLFVTGATLLIGLLLLWRRQKYDFVTMVVSVVGGTLLNVLLKSAFHRHRPSFNDPVLYVSGYSFPSGHTMAATVFYGALAVILIRKLNSWSWRVLVVLLATVMVLLIAFSRVYLGAHYLSDVLGAIAEGVAWLAISVTAVETLRRRKIRDRREPSRNL